MPTLSLVIPAYNEEARLPGLLDVLDNSAASAVSAAGLELLEVLIVDDGSIDRTRTILTESSRPGITPVLTLRENSGKGAAVAAGVRHATGDYVLLADVDLSTPLGELSKLSAAISDGADLAIGSRAVEGAIVERGPAHRKLTGKAFNGTVQMLTGLGVRDTQNGFKLLRTVTAKELFREQICPGFAFDVELLMRAKAAGLQITEVPVLYVHDGRSRVKVGRASLQMLRDVAALSYRLRPRRSATQSRTERRAWLSDLPADDSD